MFYVPPTAKLIWGQGPGLKYYLTDRRELGSKVYKVIGLITSPQGDSEGILDEMLQIVALK